jgi:hypothetical protein
MPQPKAFEELVLEYRDRSRQRYGKGLSEMRGPMAYGKTLSEQEQDDLWMHADPQYRDPQAFALLTLPKEQGGQGLTPLAASYKKYPDRQRLVEGAGREIEAQIKYAEKRRKRMLAKQPTEPVAPMAAQDTATDHSAQFVPPEMPMTPPTPEPQMEGY